MTMWRDKAETVRATAARLPAAAAVVGALPALPLRTASFDAVAANFVINHVARPAVAVAELRRSARPGGRVGVTVWPRPTPPLQRLWDDVLDAAGGLASIGAVLARQDVATVRRIKAAYDRLAGAHLDDAGLLRLRTAAVLAAGTA